MSLYINGIFIFILCWFNNCLTTELDSTKHSTVFIAILARNKAHTLPYFLTLLQDLSYPKDRISLWIRSDHNEDETINILSMWLSSVEGLYHSVDVVLDTESSGLYPDERGSTHWSRSRFDNVISLREAAFQRARKVWADYVFFLDADVFLTNHQTLQSLMNHGYTVSAPMLKSDGLYSNFWYGMTEDYYYLRTDDYKPTLNRERIGCFHVPMIHSAVLVDLRKVGSDKLTFVPEKIINYDGPHDDIITFALSCNKSNVPLYVCNDNVYGFVMVPLEQTDPLRQDLLQLTNLKLEVLIENDPLYVSELFKDFIKLPGKNTMSFDVVYMINLVRRPERRIRMLQCFDELGIDAVAFDAVDGRSLNDSILKEWGINFMPEYADPYHKRRMTLGEIGCFLSHYFIWKQVVENGYESVMVLEDDIRFEPYFRLKVEYLMSEVRQVPDWDLVYLGRKRLQEADEPWVEGSRYLVRAGYSYWTLGYVLSQRGARKLLDAKPLENMVPVDEYLPILFDKHPRDNWKGHFPQRNLVALSAAPLLLYPTHYTGEKGYVSDTEDSVLIPSALVPASAREDL